MTGSALTVPRPRVLLVDPDAETLAAYEMLFVIAGFDAAQASDGRDALAKALKDKVPKTVAAAADETLSRLLPHVYRVRADRDRDVLG